MSDGKVCSIEGCGGTYQMRSGLCNKHYLRNRRSGKQTTEQAVASATPEVLAKAVTDYMPLIKSEAWRISYRLAEDIIQETVVAIMRSMTFDPEAGVAAWVRLTVKGAYKHIRQRERRHIKETLQRGTNIEDLRTDLPNQEDAVELSELRTRLAFLPERQRDAAELLMAGHDVGDLSGLLGISYQGANQLVRRMRISLSTNIRGGIN